MIGMWFAEMCVLLIAFSGISGPAPVPCWTVEFKDPIVLRDYLGQPWNNRTSGIAVWDKTHVAVYYLRAVRHLSTRNEAQRLGGNWTFSLNIIRTDNGEVDQTVDIPATDSSSELAVVTGGLIESNYGSVTFYSRDFKQIYPAFTYIPHGQLQTPLPGNRLALTHLHVSSDKTFAVLVDGQSLQSRFFLFDGMRLKLVSKWIVPNVDYERVFIDNNDILFLNQDGVWMTKPDGTYGRLATSGQDRICRVPLAYQVESYIHVCGSIELVTNSGSELLYAAGRHETAGLEPDLSSDQKLAAFLNITIRGGGILDTNERLTRSDILVATLDDHPRVCKIPLVPLPKTQLAFKFANDSTLIILDDGKLYGYKVHC